MQPKKRLVAAEANKVTKQDQADGKEFGIVS